VNRPVADALTDLLRETDGERIELAGLDEAAVASLLRATAHPNVALHAGQFAARLREDTGGNPFFLTELIPQLVDPARRTPVGILR
jgi:predicted ATPase